MKNTSHLAGFPDENFPKTRSLRAAISFPGPGPPRSYLLPQPRAASHLKSFSCYSRVSDLGKILCKESLLEDQMSPTKRVPPLEAFSFSSEILKLHHLPLGVTPGLPGNPVFPFSHPPLPCFRSGSKHPSALQHQVHLIYICKTDEVGRRSRKIQSGSAVISTPGCPPHSDTLRAVHP